MTKELSDILVVSDVDGTLVKSGYEIPKENIKAIERFSNLGGRFSFATGRGIALARNYADCFALSAPAILVNGGVIYDYSIDKILFERTLDAGVRTVLGEITDAFPQIGVEIICRDKVVIVKMNDEVHKHTSLEHTPMTFTDADTVGNGWNKVLFAGKPEEIGKLQEYIKKRIIDDEIFKKYYFVQTSGLYYELLPLNTNKAFGLEKLAQLLNIRIENTVAIGDYYNDIELLNAAGLSAVVADAPDEIKNNADIVVGPCLKGGVAELLYKIIDSCR